MQAEPTNISNIESKIKKMVIFLGILLFLGVAVLVILLFLKPSKNNMATPNNMEISHNINFNKSCYPVTITYKENYIAITSSSCAEIKVLSPLGKITSYHY